MVDVRWNKDLKNQAEGSEGKDHVDSVVRPFAAGDPDAAAEIRARVRRIVAFRGFRIPREDRLDLEQTIMFQIWQAVGRSDFDGTGFWGFVEIVASRRCIDWFRSRKGEVSLEPELERADTRPGPLRRALSRERAELANAALARLPEPCRELIHLHAGLNKSYKEISGLLGREEGALRVQLHRCIQRANRILSELQVSGPKRPDETEV